MTKDEIFQIAQQCFPSDRRMWSVDADLPALERFAALVAAAEREACAKACDFKALTWRVRPVPMLGYSAELEDCAADIRARGNT